MDAVAGTVSVGDGTQVVNTADADVTQGSGTSGVRTLVFHLYEASAFTGSITVNFPSSVNAAATLFSFNGIVSPSPKDLCHTAIGNSITPSSGTTATTCTGAAATTTQASMVHRRPRAR